MKVPQKLRLHAVLLLGKQTRPDTPANQRHIASSNKSDHKTSSAPNDSWLASYLSCGQSESCHLRELDLCAATLVVFTQSPSGLATSDQDLNKQCGYLREADTCLKNFIQRCTTPLQRQMVDFMGEGSTDLLDEYCKPGTELRKAYLKHATCLNGAQKSHQKVCIKDLQTALESLTTTSQENWNKRMPMGCCAYRRFEQCLGGQVEKKCGKEALNFINLILKRAFSRLPDMLCRKYKPEGSECKAILPPPGAVPKGKPLALL